jgi:hypothetical protein
MSQDQDPSIESLAQLLKPWQIDWEPAFRDQVWVPRRKLRRTGL